MESLTLYCRSTVSKTENFPSRFGSFWPEISIEGSFEPWRSLTIPIQNMEVKASRLFFEQRADAFCKLRARTMVYIEERRDSDPVGVKTVIDHLEHSEIIIGLVADPSFKANVKLIPLIRFLAIEYEALIFDGRDMFDGSGEIIA